MRELEQQCAIVGYATHGTQSVLDEVGGVSSIPKAGSAETVNAENVACEVPRGNDRFAHAINVMLNIRVELPTVEVSQHAIPLLLYLYGSLLVPATRVNHHTCIATLEGDQHG